MSHQLGGLSMVAIKENKQYSVNTEDEQKQYLAQGYDIWNGANL